MASKKHSNAKSLASAFKNMQKAGSEGGTGGTFKAAATKAGHPDTPEGRKAFAKKVIDDDSATSKMKKKANFYLNVINKD